jgi:hypothetical protein
MLDVPADDVSTREDPRNYDHSISENVKPVEENFSW